MPTIKNRFEYNVLKAACFFGLVRSVIEVSRDLVIEDFGFNFYLDCAFIIMFSATLITLSGNFPFRRIIFIFYIPFILLLTIMFIDGVGLAHSIENNIFAGIIIISLTMRNWMPVYFSLTLIICTIIALVVVEYQHHLFDNYEVLSSNSFSFIFASTAAIAFTLYAKSEFARKRKELSMAITSLDQRNQELLLKNNELLGQKEALEIFTNNADVKVRSKSSKLKSQKAQVEKYLSITMTELFDAYQNTINCIDELSEPKERDEITNMMILSGENLKREMERLRTKIEEGVHELG